jgi:hypothetical protein
MILETSEFGRVEDVPIVDFFGGARFSFCSS